MASWLKSWLGSIDASKEKSSTNNDTSDTRDSVAGETLRSTHLTMPGAWATGDEDVNEPLDNSPAEETLTIPRGWAGDKNATEATQQPDIKNNNSAEASATSSTTNLKDPVKIEGTDESIDKHDSNVNAGKPTYANSSPTIPKSLHEHKVESTHAEQTYARPSANPPGTWPGNSDHESDTNTHCRSEHNRVAANEESNKQDSDEICPEQPVLSAAVGGFDPAQSLHEPRTYANREAALGDTCVAHTGTASPLHQEESARALTQTSTHSDAAAKGNTPTLLGEAHATADLEDTKQNIKNASVADSADVTQRDASLGKASESPAPKPTTLHTYQDAGPVFVTPEPQIFENRPDAETRSASPHANEVLAGDSEVPEQVEAFVQSTEDQTVTNLGQDRGGHEQSDAAHRTGLGEVMRWGLGPKHKSAVSSHGIDLHEPYERLERAKNDAPASISDMQQTADSRVTSPASMSQKPNVPNGEVPDFEMKEGEADDEEPDESIRTQARESSMQQPNGHGHGLATDIEFAATPSGNPKEPLTQEEPADEKGKQKKRQKQTLATAATQDDDSSDTPTPQPACKKIKLAKGNDIIEDGQEATLLVVDFPDLPARRFNPKGGKSKSAKPFKSTTMHGMPDPNVLYDSRAAVELMKFCYTDNDMTFTKTGLREFKKNFNYKCDVSSTAPPSGQPAWVEINPGRPNAKRYYLSYAGKLAMWGGKVLGHKYLNDTYVNQNMVRNEGWRCPLMLIGNVEVPDRVIGEKLTNLPLALFAPFTKHPKKTAALEKNTHASGRSKKVTATPAAASSSGSKKPASAPPGPSSPQPKRKRKVEDSDQQFEETDSGKKVKVKDEPIEGDDSVPDNEIYEAFF